VMLGTHMLVSSKQIWRPYLATWQPSCFFQFKLAWRSFPQARGSGCWSFDSPRCFIYTKCVSSVSVRFWSHRAHSVCICALVTILVFPKIFLYYSFLQMLLRSEQ
jgi:hypothetical protein